MLKERQPEKPSYTINFEIDHAEFIGLGSGSAVTPKGLNCSSVSMDTVIATPVLKDAVNVVPEGQDEQGMSLGKRD